MSSFNETITMDSFQGGASSVSLTRTRLIDATNKKTYKCLVVKNTHATGLIWVGKSNVTNSNGFLLLEHQSIRLEVDNPSQVWIVSNNIGTSYTWYAH